MRTLLVSAALLLAGTGFSHADKAEDWMVCLIGQSAIALTTVDGDKPADEQSDAAQDIAWKKCPEPKGKWDEQELTSLEDFVNMTVLQMAGAFCENRQ